MSRDTRAGHWAGLSAELGRSWEAKGKAAEPSGLAASRSHSRSRSGCGGYGVGECVVCRANSDSGIELVWVRNVAEGGGKHLRCKSRKGCYRRRTGKGT